MSLILLGQENKRSENIYICVGITQATSVGQSPTKTSVLISRKQVFTLTHILLSKKKCLSRFQGDTNEVLYMT